MKIIGIFALFLLINGCSLFNYADQNLILNKPVLRFPADEQPDAEADSLHFYWSCPEVENRNLTYEIQICSDSLFSDNVISEKSHSNSIAIRNLNYETEYYWKVAAYDGKLSSESEMFSFTTKPDFPNWWGVQDNDEFLYLYGTAGGESQTETVKSAKENVEYNKRNFIFQMMYPLTDKFMKEAVVTDEIAKKMLKEVMKLTSDFQYEKVKTVKLETMKVTETKYRSYVQMKLSKRDVKKVFIKKMISAFKLHKELMYSASYQRFLREFE